MFFDDRQQDELYPQLLLSIARTQRELLDCRFHWAERRPLPRKKTGLFGRKSADPKYDGLLAKLEEQKRRTQQHRAEMGYGNGVFWWNLPWAQLEDYLIYDLAEENEVGNWRFHRTWETEQTDRGTLLLLLREEGHFSSFSTYTRYETGIVSSYSAEEINSKMRDYTRMMNNYDLMTLAFAGDSPVQSWLTGAEYESGAHYLLSAEHYMVRDHLKTQYARTLYTEKETTTTTVYSNSVHYEAVYAVAEFSLSGGGVRSLTVHNYGLCGARGEMPEDIRELYASKDAAVGCAAYLADRGAVSGVPMKLFGGGLENGVVSFQDAVRQAEIYTCLADKIVL